MLVSRDQENTMRTLANQPLLESVRCVFGLHKWSQWGPVQKTTYSAWPLQESSCVLCNKIRMRKINV